MASTSVTNLAPMNTQSASPQLDEIALQAQYGENAYTETRKVSSVILESTVIGEVPRQDNVRYVEVPTIEEQVTYVTKHEIVEVEKRVPKYEYETVEKIVEVPRVVTVDRTIEVPQFVDKIIEKKVTQVVNRPVEVVVEKKIPRVVTREQIVEVAGETIEVPQPYKVEVPVEVPVPEDRRVPVIVSQTVKPVISEGHEAMVVDVIDYEPEVIPVDVHVAKPVHSALQFLGQTDAKHRLVNITAAQYNTILRQLNSHMDDKLRSSLPFVQEHNTVPFVSEAHFIVAPDHVWPVANQQQTHSVHTTPREEVYSFQEQDKAHRSRACCGPSASAPKAHTEKSRTRSKSASHRTGPTTQSVHTATSHGGAQTKSQTHETVSYVTAQPTVSAHHSHSHHAAGTHSHSHHSAVAQQPQAQTLQPYTKELDEITSTSYTTSSSTSAQGVRQQHGGSVVSAQPPVNKPRSRACC